MVDAGKVVLFIIIMVVVFVVYVSGYGSAQDQAINLLRADGVTGVQMTGYQLFGCSDSDTYTNGFNGIKNGHRVEGVVCSGMLKGATIRYTGVQ